MKQATKMVLGAAAIVAVSAGVAGVTTYSMLKPEPNKSVALMMCSNKIRIQDLPRWTPLKCNRWI